MHKVDKEWTKGRFEARIMVPEKFFFLPMAGIVIYEDYKGWHFEIALGLLNVLVGVGIRLKDGITNG